MKHKYREGPEVREEFERTMKELFRAPKQEIERKPKATERKTGEERDKD